MKVVYFCHAGQETGYGRAATDLALALLRAGVKLEVVPINKRLSSFLDGRAAALAPHVRSLGDCDDADVCIVHTTPLDCWRPHETYRAAADHGRCPWIAYTTWEGVGVPESVMSALMSDLGDFADIWVPSTSTQDAFLNSDDQPVGVFVLPHAFDVKERASYLRYEAETGHKFKDKSPYRFLYVGAWNTRKNPHGLLRAYAHAFTPGDDVELVVHSPGVSVEMFTAALVATGLEQREMPRVRLSAERMPGDTMMHLYSGYDCFVTATRGESWNLPAFEAMLAGRMVIAPGGMGHDDFLFEDAESGAGIIAEDLTSARRVASIHQPAFVDVGAAERAQVGGLFAGDPPGRPALAFTTIGAQGLSSKTLWRDPDLVSLGFQMRSAYERRERDITLHYQPEDRFGYEAVAKRAIARIEWLLNGRKTT